MCQLLGSGLASAVLATNGSLDLPYFLIGRDKAVVRVDFGEASSSEIVMSRVDEDKSSDFVGVGPGEEIHQSATQRMADQHIRWFVSGCLE